MSKPQILLIDDDASSIQLLRRALGDVAEMRFATNGTDALRLASELPPDLMLLDAEMPGINGFELCATVKANASLSHIPVIFVTSHGEPEFEVAGLEMGAADFVSKPINPPLLQARVKTQLRIKQMSDELRRMVTLDPFSGVGLDVTGVANRARFDAQTEREWLRLRRTLDPLSLIVVELNHFRRYAERYGVEAADASLGAVARALVASCQRPADAVGRLANDKFALLLPQTPRDGAACVARKVMAAVAGLSLDHDASPNGMNLTVSLGLSSYDDLSPSWIIWPSDLGFAREQQARLKCNASELFAAAEKALVVANLTGGDRAYSLDLSNLANPALAEELEMPLAEALEFPELTPAFG